MEWVVWIGVGLTLAGLALLVYCVVAAMKVRNLDADEEAKRAALQKIVPLNVLALMTSAMGLGAVTVGVLLS